MRNKIFALMAGIILVSPITGCDPIQEPWVNNENDLRQERKRTDVQMEQLRNRLAYTQIDR